MSASAGINATIVGSPAISFYNDGAYIRANNANTGAVIYYKKIRTTFLCDGGTSFLMQSDDAATQYLYADVARPASATLPALLEIFQAWIEEYEQKREGSPFVSDGSTTVIEVKTFYDKDPLRIAEYALGSATTTYDAGRNAVSMDVTTSQTSRIVRQTKAYAPLNVNKSLFAAVSGVMIVNASARNVVSKVGVFEDIADRSGITTYYSGNGVFFQWKSGEGLSLVFRSDYSGTQTDVTVAQASWNVDALDGTGASGLTLDPTAENTFIFEWSTINGSLTRAGYLADGAPLWCHKFVNVRMGCASVPARWEIGRNDVNLAVGSNDAAQMYQGAASVVIQGKDDAPAWRRSRMNSVVKSVTAANSPQPVLSINPRADMPRARIFLQRVHLLNLDQGAGKWYLLLNATRTGATLQNHMSAGYSLAQWSESATAVSGGHVIASGYFSEGSRVIDVSDKNISLCADVRGASDSVTLAVEYCRGVVTVSAAFDWVEKE